MGESQDESKVLQKGLLEEHAARQAVQENFDMFRTQRGAVDEPAKIFHRNHFEDQELCVKQKFLLGRSKETIESIKAELSRLGVKRKDSIMGSSSTIDADLAANTCQRPSTCRLYMNAIDALLSPCDDRSMTKP